MHISSNASLITTLIIIFTTGFLSGLSPCSLPTVAFVVAYVGGKQEYDKKKGFILSFSFVMGIALVLSVLGIFAGLLGNLFIKTNILNYIIAAILVIMGLWMLKVINFNINDIELKNNPKKGSGVLGAFLLGIPFGISASPCTMPITASVLAYSATKGSPLIGFVLMFTYAIGRSLPLLVVGTFTGLLNNIKGLSKYQCIIEKISGVILIILALYFIWKA
jgi:cytochrome c-type biogenesis protein